MTSATNNADLDLADRSPAGLLLIALFLSLFLSIFLLSLGGLVWMMTRVMLRDAGRISDAAMWDAAVARLLHEDLGLLRTVRIYGVENIAALRHQTMAEADTRRIKTEGRLNLTIGLLFGSAAILLSCCSGAMRRWCREPTASAVIVPVAHWRA